MSLTQEQQTEIRRLAIVAKELQAWDWKSELKAQERPYTWLAKHTKRPVRTVYDYVYGRTKPPLAWLVDAWGVLKEGVRA